MIVFSNLLEWVFLLKSFKFNWQSGRQELINWLISSTNLDLDASSHDFKNQVAATKLVLTFLLPHEHKLELRFVRIIVDVLGKDFVNLVAFNRNIVGNSGFDVKYVCLKSLCFRIVAFCHLPHLIKQLNARLVRLIALLF